MKFLQCFPIFACKGKVEILDYSCQKLDAIPDAVFKHGKYLEDLNLSMNNIIELPLALFKMHKIQRLILSNNRIGGIPSQIGDLKYLLELDISNNEICDIAEEIEKCQQLIVLDISHNILPGSLPKSIVNLTQLTHLSITDNSLTALPAEIDKLVNLKSLDARECELRVLPTSIVNLKNLQRLDLGANALTELPIGFGGLENLRELDLEENTLTSLPEDLLKCKNLESLVLCNNSLTELPKDIGSLTNLIELNVNDNELMGIPSSIRLLTNLKVLKLNQNSIEEVPQSVGSLESLKELYLYRNMIRSLPSSIGKLHNLEFLDASDNHIQTLPSTIGSLVNLGTLLLRNNELKELPDEIGRLNNLKVLDVAENKLNYLPYTMLAIKETLKTIYLVPDRPMKVSNLKEGIRDRFNVKTLTCYALPQKESIDVNQLVPEIKSTIGGTRVNFVGDLSENEMSIDDKQIIGNFERYGTPHPKYFAPKNQQKIIQSKRNSKDLTGILAPCVEPEEFDIQPVIRPLRSVLKKRPQSTISLKDETIKTVIIRKINDSFGFNLFGGIDSEIPFKDDDYGFFISKIVDNGSASQSGLNIGDKILAVNGKPVTGLTHLQCSNLIQDGDLVELRIESITAPDEISAQKENILKNSAPIELPRNQAPELKKEESEMTTDIISVTFKCDINGNPGFTINGGTATVPCYINDIIPNGPADQTKKLKHGDRILSINGKNVQFSKLNDVRQLLKGNKNDLDLYLVVERLNFKSMSNLTKTLLKPSTSLPSIIDFIKQEEEKSIKNNDNGFNRHNQMSFTYGHRRKPSSDFKCTNFLVEFSSEPQSGFKNVKTKSIGNLFYEISNEKDEKMIEISTFSNEEKMSVNTPTITMSSSSIQEEKMNLQKSQLKQPIATLKKENVSLTEMSTSPLPTSSSTPIPTTKVPEVFAPTTKMMSSTLVPATKVPEPSVVPNTKTISSTMVLPTKIPSPTSSPTTKIPPPTFTLPTKIPPPIAPKPKISSPNDPPEKLNFVSKIQMFEQEISSQILPKNNLTNIPPPKKPLLSSNDLETLKHECETRNNKIEMEEEMDNTPSSSITMTSTSNEYEQMLDKIVTPPTMPAVIRTKKAEMRAQAALANISNGTCSPSPSNSSLIRSDSVISGNGSNVDEQEIERHRRWRSERMKSIEDATKNADELLNQIRQISRMSNISEPIPTS